MNKPVIVSAAFQFVPVKGMQDPVALIDEIIALIQQSGLVYRVCPFETAVEGSMDKILALQHEILAVAHQRPGLEFLLYVKFHAASGENRTLDEKTGRFHSQYTKQNP